MHQCKTCPHPPTPSPKIGIRGANLKVPLPNLGEGFRVRVKIHARSLLSIKFLFKRKMYRILSKREKKEK
ncbi:hypothetical protein SD81_039400 [Tolypothrix campylonemoides VB511288]|nr:hypothetical protein SD81_039400 [Tolypothrix campylonemoides VB511288]